MPTEIVIVALRKQGERSCVGYFPSVEEVPADWKLAVNPEFDIVHIKERLPDASKEQIMAMLNEHWMRR